MATVQLQRRFLLAMGVSAVSGFACSKTPPAGSSVDATTTTTTATATATASATTTAVTTATAPTPSGVGPLGIGHPTGGGGCGFRITCEAAPAAKPAAHAAAPYERCAAQIPKAEGYNDGTFDAEATANRRAKAPSTCCYKSPRAFCGGGRPLQGPTGPIVAPAISRRDWIDGDLLPLESSPESSRESSRDPARAAQWLEDAAVEHASVASFARASLQLLALGAPPELIRDTHQAALDEIEHARVCYALAARRGAAVMGPGPLAIGPSLVTGEASALGSIESFIRDTFLEGCVAETLAAIDVRARASSGDEVERAALTRIADDEDRHAELAWRTLAWGVRAGGELGARALTSALAQAIDEARETSSAMSELVVPCARALLADHSRTMRQTSTSPPPESHTESL